MARSEISLDVDMGPLRRALEAMERRIASRVDDLEDRVDALPLEVAAARTVPPLPWRAALGALLVGGAFGLGVSVGLVPIALVHAYATAGFLLAW